MGLPTTKEPLSTLDLPFILEERRGNTYADDRVGSQGGHPNVSIQALRSSTTSLVVTTANRFPLKKLASLKLWKN